MHLAEHYESAFGVSDLADALGVDPLSDEVVEELADALDESSLLTRLRLVSPSFLKSVSYQPLPANRKEGAVIWR